MRTFLIFCLSLSVLSCTSRKASDSQEAVESKISSIIGQMTLEEKIEMIGGIKNNNIRPLPRLGIPEVKMPDGPTFVREYGRLTVFPSGINCASTWDTALIMNVGKAIGAEFKSKGAQVWLYPGMNIYRAPMCGRNFEYFGEDPFLAGQMAAAYIIGIQSEGVMATAKHFAGNNQEYDRSRVSSDIDERTLHEIYFPAFKTSVEKGKVACFMTSYNLLNGIYTSQNDYLINQVLKKGWGFQGFVMSDWNATHDGVASANAGLDLEMPSGIHMCKDTLIPAVKSGMVKESVIDDKIRRILRMYYRFGFMEDTARLHREYEVDHQGPLNIALESAREGIILLKNKDNILPLDTRKLRTIAVLGPNCEIPVTGGGGSSFLLPNEPTSVLKTITQFVGDKVKVLSSPGSFNRFSDDFYRNTVFEGEGLKGEFFNNTKLEGNPAATIYSKTLNNIWKKGTLPAGVNPHNISARWVGKYKATETGVHVIAVRGSDGYRLAFDGKLLLDEWRHQSDKTTWEKVWLQEGRLYDIEFEFFEGGDAADVGFTCIGIGREVKDPIGKSISLAKQADVALVFAGFDNVSETEGQDRPFGLPEEQVDFIKSVAAANKNTIVIVNAGGNVGIADWIDHVAGLLHAGYPGEKGAQAVTEVLFGEVNPSGKLPYSVEKKWEDNAVYNSYYDTDNDNRVQYSEGIFLGYRHFDKSGVEPLFPFGFGLSYTSFDYKNLRVKKEFAANDTLLVSLDVKNTGPVAGKEVVELYVSDKQSSLPRPVKELKAFSKVGLEAGETKTVTMKLDRGAFSFYDSEKHEWVTEPGEFEILVGSSSKDIRLMETVMLK